MSQNDFWKQFINHTRNWKVVEIALRHIEKPLTAGTVRGR